MFTPLTSVEERMPLPLDANGRTLLAQIFPSEDKVTTLIGASVLWMRCQHEERDKKCGNLLYHVLIGIQDANPSNYFTILLRCLSQM